MKSKLSPVVALAMAFASSICFADTIRWDHEDILPQFLDLLAETPIPSTGPRALPTAETAPQTPPDIESVPYAVRCVAELKKDWGTIFPSHMEACQLIVNPFALRCVVAVVKDWGTMYVSQIESCAKVQTNGGALCVEVLVEDWGSTSTSQIDKCANMF
ncbi:MAG: hypothetical protein AAB268_09670 [Elusimicrobiota bacterium]